MSADPSSGSLSSQTECVTALRALAQGQLRDWHGLPPGCDRAGAETAIGSGAEIVSGLLGGMPTQFRDYPATPAAPAGIRIWYEGDTIIAVQIETPALAEPIDQLLGTPEQTEKSLLQSFHTQWIYAGRGLTAHVSNTSHVVLRLYGYPPTSVDEFLQSSLSRVENRRIPLNRR